jgi:uncharacterized membrane protein
MIADTRPVARTVTYSIFAMLIPFPIAGFSGGLLTDIAYWRTAEMMWSDFSAWLIAAGVIMGWLAAIAGLVDGLVHRPVYDRGTALLHGVMVIVMLVLATANMLIHTRDAWTSVVPWGLALSVATVVALLFTGWLGWSTARRPIRHGVVS